MTKSPSWYINTELTARIPQPVRCPFLAGWTENVCVSVKYEPGKDKEMKILPNFPETQTHRTENQPAVPELGVLFPFDAWMPSSAGLQEFVVRPLFFPGLENEFSGNLMPASVPAWLMPDSGSGSLPQIGTQEPVFSGAASGTAWDLEAGFTVRDLPPFVVTNSYDDEEDDEGMDDLSDGDDEDIYEEVESYADFDDDFDDDFEDEFDEDYEDLARIDDEDGDGDEDELGTTSTRYEEEFGDVDSQTKFLPDNEETIIDEIDESESSVFNDFGDDEENEAFNEYDA